MTGKEQVILTRGEGVITPGNVFQRELRFLMEWEETVRWEMILAISVETCLVSRF